MDEKTEFSRIVVNKGAESGLFTLTGKFKIVRLTGSLAYAPTIVVKDETRKAVYPWHTVVELTEAK